MIQELKQLQFFSKDCRNDKHSECSACWEGLGFVATCDCTCHKQEQKALADSSHAIQANAAGASPHI